MAQHKKVPENVLILEKEVLSIPRKKTRSDKTNQLNWRTVIKSDKRSQVIQKVTAECSHAMQEYY